MRSKLEEKANKFITQQEKLREKQENLSELQTDVFGADSEETEEKAREFFSDVGGLEQKSSKTQEIDELRDELEELKDALETTREELQELLVEVQFPLNETVNVSDDVVEFPYSAEIPQSVIDAIEAVLQVDLSEDGVVIDTDAIRVKTTDVDEAMDQAMNRIDELRSKANTMVDVEQYVNEINGRDEKLAKTLYVLYQTENALTKKELEKRIGVETGELRGQLYYVLENDPYLKKSDQKFSLSDTGERVTEAYIDRHGRPEGLPDEVKA
ncbi:hypothetical protein ACFQDG_01895 [Natronoarchaeum mannanilyticum]|uniref:Uncharacterized protein n=1 Tax=Natronoarchaeum mannanilyticum TaxID=926360 RepID=A0AAV3TC59_9EURY